MTQNKKIYTIKLNENQLFIIIYYMLEVRNKEIRKSKKYIEFSKIIDILDNAFFKEIKK